MAKRRLTRQQRERIHQTHSQRREKAARRMAHQLETLSPDGLGQAQWGLVVANHGPAAIIEDREGGLYRCAVRQNLSTLVCGDQVVWQTSGDGEGVVTAIEERRSLLTRPDYSGRLKPVAANLDEVAVVVAPRPEMNEFLIDRYLVAIDAIGVEALVVLNKIDTLDAAAFAAMEARLAVYRHMGYTVLYASSRSSQGLEPLRQRLIGHTTILLGQSGVGKSSLIKALLPHRDIRIQALSQATGLGTHTTTTSALYHLPDGGDLIDSPGVRSFELSELHRVDLEHGFVEFGPYLGRCKFSNCSHRVEPGCALLAAVAEGKIDARRLRSYHQLRDSLAGK